jgi:hypothetical protein
MSNVATDNLHLPDVSIKVAAMNHLVIASAMLALMLTTLASEATSTLCARYNSPVSLSGTVIQRTVHGIPLHEDLAISVLVLVLDKPICVVPVEGNNLDDPEDSVENIEINLSTGFFGPEVSELTSSNKQSARLAKRYKGKRVTVYGSLYHGFRARELTRVLIEGTTIMVKR